MRIALAQSWRRRTVSWALEASWVDVRRPNLWHWRRLPSVPSWFVALALETCGRLVTRQLAGRDRVGQRVRAAVSVVARGRDWSKTHRAAGVAHHGWLSVRDESRHSLHACHGATAAVGASLPVTSGRADPRGDGSRVVVRVGTASVRMRRPRSLALLLSALTRTVRHAGQASAVERQCSDITSVRRGFQHAQDASVGQRVGTGTHWRGGADGARGSSGGGDIAGPAVAATDAGNGIGERHCAAFGA